MSVMAEIFNGGMSRTKKIIIAVVAILFLLLVTYATILYNDYNRVMRQYTKPAYAINQDPVYHAYYDLKSWEDPIANGFDIFLINYGVFQGLGYTIELSGSFRPYSEITWETDIIGSNEKYVWQGENAAILGEDQQTVLNPVPGVLQARFILFGKEIGHLNRPYPADNFVPRGFVMRDIFE